MQLICIDLCFSVSVEIHFLLKVIIIEQLIIFFTSLNSYLAFGKTLFM